MSREFWANLRGKPSGATRRTTLRADSDWMRPLRSRSVVWGLTVWTVFIALGGTIAAWTRDHSLPAVGRIAKETRTVRQEFEVADLVTTDQRRHEARQRAPRIYTADIGALEEIERSILNLPGALADVESLDRVEPGIRQQFGLTEETLAAVRAVAGDIEKLRRWETNVAQLALGLRRLPQVDARTFQVEQIELNDQVELRFPAPPGAEGAPPGALEEPLRVRSSSVINVVGAQHAQEMTVLAAYARFQGPLLDVVVARLTTRPKPTFIFDEPATAAAQEAAAAAVPVQIVRYIDRQIIYRRGDTLTATHITVLNASIAAEAASKRPWQRWLEHAGMVGLVTATTLAIAGYGGLFLPRLRRNPARLVAIALLLLAGLGVACYGTVTEPSLVALTTTAPTLLVAVLLGIAYDQRVALAYGVLHGVLVAAALRMTVAEYAVIIAGVGAAVWLMKELRDRTTLIRIGLASAASMGLATVVAGLVDLPVNAASLRQIVRVDAGLAASGGLLVAMLTVFFLPTLERVFDITTGLTLIELRDPKQPLLRELQVRAPGTYNHSLNLASLAEAGSEAIGANGLLAYVGALYHDVGKMNKPDYFVENQSPGFNRHDKLSPAMSLLVIVGHVKDGMELAREFGLPRSLHHFIESHHGTTLVEYFYHRAKKQAEAGAGGGDDGPKEIEYRYPGPKPRSKEAAIVMISDAVESASRAMADPTPARIDALVRAIATRRLMDGQFDECDLTLRELNTVVETVSKTLASIYHGRIAYPGSAGSEPPAGGGDRQAARAAATLAATAAAIDGESDAKGLISPATQPALRLPR